MAPVHAFRVVVANWPNGWISTAVSVANVVAFVVLTLYIIAINRRQSLTAEFQAFAVERDRAASALSDANEVAEATATVAARIEVLKSRPVEEILAIHKFFPGFLLIPEQRYVQRLVTRVFADPKMISDVEVTYFQWSCLQALLTHATDSKTADATADKKNIIEALDQMAEHQEAAEEAVRLAVERYRVQFDQADSRLQRVATIIQRQRGICAWWRTWRTRKESR